MEARLRAFVTSRGRFFVVLCSLTLALAALLLGLDVPLRTADAPRGIVSFERARDLATAARILVSWDEAGALATARTSLLADFPFLVCYSTTLAFACLWLAFRDWSGLWPWLARLLRRTGLLLGPGQWIAALCDVVENVALLKQLPDGPRGGLAALAFAFASAKFAILLAAGLYIALALAGLAFLGRRRLPFLHYLYFCRFPLLFAALLLGLAPICVLGVPTLLRSLFDLDGAGLAAVTALALLAAWTTLLTLGNVLRYGGSRFGVADARDVASWLRRHRLLLAADLAAPAVIVALCLSRDVSAMRQVLSVAVGVCSAFLFLLLAALFQERLGDPARGPEEEILETPLARFVRPAHPAPDDSTAPGAFPRLPPSLRPAFKGYLGSGGRFEPGHAQAMLFLLVTLAAYLALYRPLSPGQGGWSFPALGYLLVLLSALAWLLPGISFFFDRWRVPTSLVVLGVLTANSAVFDVGYRYAVHARPADVAAVAVGDALAANDRALGKDAPIVVVAASGGGIRAALWTARVLTGLQHPTGVGPDFARSIRLISSVSGGSVGTMFYLDAFGGQGPPREGGLVPILEHARANALDAAAWGLAYPDLWRGFFGLPFLCLWDHCLVDRRVDRGWALETAWKQRLADGGVRLSAWRARVGAGAMPPAVLNATLVETGEQLVLTPLQVPRSWSARSLGDVDLDVATAARLSATFPWVSPASTAALAEGQPAPAEARLHAADGGYYDNFGVVSAVNWVQTVMSDRLGEAERRGIILVVISASPLGSLEADPLVSLERPSRGQGLLFAWAGPLITLAHVRSSTQLKRNRIEIELLEQRWRAARVPIASFVFEPPDSGPLSWKLTSREAESIMNHWSSDSNSATLGQLRDCFRDIRGCSQERAAAPPGSPPPGTPPQPAPQADTASSN